MSSVARAFGLALASLAVTSAMVPAVAKAESIRELYRGARAQALGNAFVGLADDEQALFMNPAGLAGVQKQSIHYMVADIEASRDILGNFQAFSTVTSPSGDGFNAIMGKNTTARVQFTPSFVMPNFGVGIIADQQFSISAKNQALPNIIVGYQATNGVQFGFGMSLLGKARNQKTDLRLGVGGKILWRRGGYRPISLTQMLNVSEEAIKAMMGSYGRGLGFDAGLQSVTQLNSRLTLSAGIAMTEISDVSFTSGADPQKSNLSAGFAFKYRLPQAAVTLASDYRHILADADWRKKMHLGAEIQLAMLNLYMSLNQMNLGYGVGFDAWLLKVTALSYAEELGTLWGQDRERRYMVRVAMKFGL